MKKFVKIIPVLLLLYTQSSGQLYQDIKTWYQYNRFRVQNVLRPPLSRLTLSIADTGSISVDPTAGSIGMWVKRGGSLLWETISGGVDTVVNTATVTFTRIDATHVKFDAAGGGSGDASTNTSSSVDAEAAVFNGTTGKSLRRFTLTGVVKATSGVLSTGNVNLTTETTGTLQIGNGGTGQATANNALNAFLPSQTGNSGKVLQTDGSNTSWQPGSGGGSGDVTGPASATDNQFVQQSGTTGKILKNYSGTGYIKTASGIPSSVTTIPNADIVSFKSYPAESQIGTIYEKDNFTEIDLAQDFTGFNGVVFFLNAGKIRCVSSTISWGTYGRFLPYRPTLLPKWTFIEEYTIVSAFGSNVGHGPAIRSNNVNGANYGYMSYLSASSSTATPHLAKEDGTSDQTGTTFTITAGDKIRMVLSFADSVLTLTAQNLTTSSAVSTVTKSFVATTAPYVPNTGTLGFSNFSGTYDISYLKFSSTATKNPTLAVAADSKGQIFAGSFAGRFPNRLNATYPTTLNYCGGGDQLKDFLDKKIEVMSLNPEQWWIILGSNDLRYGNSLTTTLNRLATIDSWFKGTQTRVYYSVIPEDSTAGHAGIGLTAFKNFMGSLYASQYIDLWTSFSTSNVLKATYNSGDDVHPNALAHVDIAAAGVASGLLTVISPNRRTDFNSSGRNIALTGDAISLVPWGKNNVLRVDDSSRLAPSLIYHDVNKLIISPNMGSVTTVNTPLLTVDGYVELVGNLGGIIWKDRTTSNYFYKYANNDQLRQGYNSTDLMFYSNTGQVKIGGTDVFNNYRFEVLDLRTGQIVNNTAIANFGNSGASFNTTSGALTTYGGRFTDSATRSAGGNVLTNIGGYFSAGNGQVNIAAHVDGPLKITDGTQGVNKVFTSDANGNGSWATPGSYVSSASTTATMQNSWVPVKESGGNNVNNVKYVGDAADVTKRVVTLQLVAYRADGSVSTGTWITIANISSTYRPTHVVYGELASQIEGASFKNSGGTNSFTANMDLSGATVRVKPDGDVQIFIKTKTSVASDPDGGPGPVVIVAITLTYNII